MLHFHSSSARRAGFMLVALVAVLGFALTVVGPQAASAQNAGQFCPVAFATGFPCNPPAQATFVCPDGTTVFAGGACPNPVVPAAAQACASGFLSPVCSRAPISYVAAASSQIVPLPGYRWTLLVNPWGTSAMASGADIVLVYDWSRGSYYETNTLPPGESAWAFSYNGGQATLTSLGF